MQTLSNNSKLSRLRRPSSLASSAVTFLYLIMARQFYCVRPTDTPKFEKIAIEFSKKKRRCKIEEIVAAIQEQQLLLDHLKKDPERQRQSDPEVKVKAAKAQQNYCYAFQKGTCSRPECPFLHEKDPKPKPPQKSQDKGAKPGKCDKCGANHPRTECKFDGECGYCHIKGHRDSVCRRKAAGKVKAHVATGDDACVSIRCALA